LSRSQAHANHPKGDRIFQVSGTVGKVIRMWNQIACAVSPHKSVYSLQSGNAILLLVCADTAGTGINSEKMSSGNSSEGTRSECDVRLSSASCLDPRHLRADKYFYFEGVFRYRLM
jgi:hypothetical protein